MNNGFNSLINPAVRAPFRGLLFGLCFWSCFNSVDTDPGTDEGTTSIISLNFNHVIDQLPLVLDTLLYTNPEGKYYEVTQLKYYLSDFTFFNESGGEVFFIDSIFYIDFDDVSTHTYLVMNAPPVDYYSLSFTFGLSPEKNITESLPFISQNIDMQWPDHWGGGYHFMKFEGKFQDTTLLLKGFGIHIGSSKYSGVNQVNSFTIAPQVIDNRLPENKSLNLQVDMNLNNWFAEPEDFDLDVYNQAIMDNQDAQEILRKNGLWNVFTVSDLGISDKDSLPPAIIKPPGDTSLDSEEFPPMVIPESNPQTKAGALLGRYLFYDVNLSRDSTLSCGSCHIQSRAFSDTSRFSLGMDSSVTETNTSALVNPGWKTSYQWDGRIWSLEDQVNEMLTSPGIMNLTWSEAVDRVKDNQVYTSLFTDAFESEGVDSSTIVRAIAQFERSLISNDSKFDKKVRGEVELTDSESRGFMHFFVETGDCFHCHGKPLFTDNGFRNNGLDADVSGTGMQSWTGKASDAGKFKTPTLRNIEITGPYMHDGRFDTLEQVLEHYNTGGHYSHTVDPLIRVKSGLGLSEKDMNDIIAFLKSLTDQTFIENPDYSDPW